MIDYRKGDILQDDAEAIVNTVNCVGVMGRGIAQQFKRAWPDNFKAYASACKLGNVLPGHMFIHDTGRIAPPRYIINFPTKRHWRGSSRIADIEAGLKALADDIQRLGIHSIAVPPLGCGLGGLSWEEDVRPRIEAILGDLELVDIRVYEPQGAPNADAMARSRDVPNMTVGRAALVELVDRYLGGLLDPFVTLLEVHKLLYFMQEAGEPLRLKYQKGPYGPYAENLRHVLSAVEGHFLSGYADGGDAPDKRLQIVPGATSEAAAMLASHHAAQARFDRVSALVDGFETPVGLELLSSVHWVMTRENLSTTAAIAEAFRIWSPRKAQFSERQIMLASQRLDALGWLATTHLESPTKSH